MSAFLYSALLQWKIDLRNKEILLLYYVVPLLFFAFMGGVFTSINPEAYRTLIQAMVVFGVSMGAFLGVPSPLSEALGGDIKKAYRVGGIPLWSVAVCHAISAFFHLLLMSLLLFCLAPLLFGADLPQNLPFYFASLALLLLACVSIGILLGLFYKSSAKGALYSQILFLPSIMLSGCLLPSEMLPGFLQGVGRVLPAYWGFRSLCGKGGWSELLPLAAVVVLACVACAARLHHLKKSEA